MWSMAGINRQAEIYGKKLGIIGFKWSASILPSSAATAGMEYMPMMPLQSQRNRKAVPCTDFHTGGYLQTVIISLYTHRFWVHTEYDFHSEIQKWRRMPALLNAARGGIVNEEALYEALKKRDTKCMLDVCWQRTSRKMISCFTLDNFLLTPHTAARSMESEQRTCAMSTANT